MFHKLPTIKPEHQEAVREAILKSARTDAHRFPDLVEELQGILRIKSPEAILASFGFYATRATMNDRGETKSFNEGMEQHHIELLQGFVLQLPIEEWGCEPPSGHDVQSVFELIPKLADIHTKRRLLERADQPDGPTRALIELQEKIRTHTQAVRNWGYFEATKSICREIYQPLDEQLQKKLGFTFTDVLEVSEVLVNIIEQRGSDYIDLLRGILRARDARTLIEKYLADMPDVEGDVDDFMRGMPNDAPREAVVGLIISHADLRHPDRMSVTPEFVAKVTNKSCDVAKAVLKALSSEIGCAKEIPVEHLFLANPAWVRPGICLGEQFLFVAPQSIFSHINEIMWQIANQAGISPTLSKRRAEYLEKKAEEVLQSALPTARIDRNVKWKAGEQQFETDILTVIDKTVLLVEAKGHRLSPPGLRGEPARLKRHLEEIVIEPSIQSERLAKLLVEARSGDEIGLEVAEQLGLQASEIDQIIRFSITLDDLSMLSVAEEELELAGILPPEHNLAPALHIADLCSISEILEHEIMFLHYFAERFHLQKQFDILGDELDFLGLYLSTGLNLGEEREDFRNIIVTGMSDIIDRYYNALDAGLKLEKPKPKLHRVYKAMIDQLVQSKPDGWTTIGIHLLSSVSPDEQKKVERGINRLRKSARRRKQNSQSKCYMQITPPLDRRAIVGFFVHRDEEKHLRRAQIEQFAADALEDGNATSCVIFARNIDHWEKPYEAVLLVQKADAFRAEMRS
ncbi:hypothetical protein IDJ81_06230 [Tsuneonella flava]|uniref:Uncharacterized protein n=1 Tax=Tsuneonella flava TaxID=2055955 RepID=A0ABX7KBP3_9SPHN|nr:hypothetical protein IDJ81_06230 [Tsuneonella flava]